MRIVPVLDVMQGVVVRGVGGRRQDYRPIVSRLTPSRNPLDVANALATHFGSRELYLADLDAILGGEPSWSLYAILQQQGFRLWVDAGMRTLWDATRLAEAWIDSIVAGLETLAHSSELSVIPPGLAPHLVFSLDLYRGEPLGNRDAWQNQDAEHIAAQVVRFGVRRLLVLDLAHVGLDSGTGTRDLCKHLCAAHPHVSVCAGGGVRNRRDLDDLKASGVQTVLLASALHDGRLTRADLDGL